MRIVVKVAPIGAWRDGLYGRELRIAIAGKSWRRSWPGLSAAVLFVVFVLGAIAWWSGFPFFDSLIISRTSCCWCWGQFVGNRLAGHDPETPRLGCAPSTVGLVIPTGYSFNLDGTNIYMAMAAVFLAQATNTPLSLSQQLGLLAVAMVTSKGASGVTGAGFVTLAATLAAVPSIPMESLALLIGIDRFMSECRALTNLVETA